MRDAFLTKAEDMQWLLDTHLNGVPLPPKYARPLSALMHGNEDAPRTLNLYTSRNPSMVDDYLHVRFVRENLVYCEYIEMNGRTSAPKWTAVSADERLAIPPPARLYCTGAGKPASA